MSRILWRQLGCVGALVALLGGVLVSVAGPAAASSGPFSQNPVTVHQTPSVICRAYGGTLSANSEADQYLGFSVSYPTDVHKGDTFNIKIRPDVSGFPEKQATGNGIAPQATVYNVWGQASGYQLPAGLTINTVTLGPSDGSIGTNPDAGYYVSNTNVPQVTNGYNVGPDPTFNPLTLDPSKLVAIPGVAPSAYWNTSTNRVYEALLGTDAAGTSSTGEFHGGSMLQGPTVTVSVTATADPVTNLAVTLAGSLPAGSFTGSQPGNFPAPVNGSTGGSLVSQTATAPWSATDGKHWVFQNGGSWTDPTYTSVATANALLTVTASAACAPGWESNGDTPTEPSYYLGVNALPNGTSPPLSSTTVDGIGVNAPFDGAHYLTGQSVNADYTCQVSSQVGNYDTCVGDQAEGAAIDTSTPGNYTFTVNATDANNDPISRTVNYSVADPLPPVANAGAAQTGKVAATVVTLDGSGSTDPNGPPALPLTYTWTQTSGPAVTLSNNHAIKPTFTVPAASNSAGDTFGFSLDVNNGYFDNTASTTVSSVASTPTVAAPTKTRVGGGTSFVAGDLTTLSVAITNPDGNNPADYSYNWVQTSGISTTLSSNTAANPTFLMPTQTQTAGCTSGNTSSTANCPEWKVTVTKTSTGKSSVQSASLANYSAALPSAPVANAGAAQTVPNAGGPVTLDGSASQQANSHTISYAWTQTAGPSVTLSDPTAQKPTFTAPAGGTGGATLTFSLTVTDTQSPITATKTSPAVTTTVNVVPDHVVANAGPDQTGKVAGNTITLDGSASTDPNLAPLTYTWTQVNNGAPTVTLNTTNPAKPTFVAPAASSPSGYVAQLNLSVTNGGPNPGDTGTAGPVSITVGASTPSVAAPTKARDGGGSTFSAGDRITLSPGAITNPDGTNPADYTYVWAQSSGIPTTLSSLTVQNPTYILPVQSNGTSACTSGTSSTTANCPEWKVTITKINTGKTSAQSASLANYGSSLATRPVANAGTAQNVKVGTALVTLNGSASTQAQGHPISYAWTQTAGPSVTLSGATNVQPTFTAPNSSTTLTFSLVVTDTNNPVVGSGTNGKTSTASTVNVTVSTYTSPVASAGADQSVHVADPVTLDASGSSQADNHALSYQWTQTAGTPVTLSDATAQQPTFTAPTAGDTLKFTVTVTDTQNPDPSSNTTTSGAVTITVNDYASPVASAGSDQSVHVADPVTLDASGSSQADNHALSYQWTQTAGTPVTLSDATAQQPSFTAPTAGDTLKFTVTVTDTQNPDVPVASTTSSEVTIAVNDYASPVASAGSDQVVIGSTGVTLDASGSSQADNHALSYQWTQTGGPLVTLSDPTAQMPTFTAPSEDSTLTFTVTATDTQNPNSTLASTTSAPVSIVVSNFASPIASAGSDQTVHVAGLVTLDASGSSQADNHDLTYQWAQTAGTPVTLSDATAQQPTFTAPNAAATLMFTVTVTDTQNPNPIAASMTSAPVTITVDDYASPVASAGTDQTVHVAGLVTLDASGSSQADNHALSYQWTQTAGTPVTLSDATNVQPTFTAPNAAATLMFTVTVTDTQNPNPDAASMTSAPVTITVDDYASPVVSAGGDQSVNTSASVSLAGSASQADGHTLTYHWTQTGGTAVSLSDASVLNPSFTSPSAAATLTFRLTATDTQNPNGAVASASDDVTINVTPPPPSGPVASVSDESIVEGNTSSRAMNFRVTLSQPATSQVTVNYTVTSGTATVSAKKGAGIDVTAKLSGSLIFKTNTRGITPTIKSITAQVWGNTNPQLDRTFHVTITSVTGGATAGRTSGTGTIIDDDNGTPGLSVGVGDAAIVEGNSGSNSVVIPVTVSDVPGATVGVSYTVAGVTATYGKTARVANADFGGKTSGLLAWTLGGTRTKNITIPIWPDTRHEGNETFTVTISNATGGVTIIRASGTGTVIDDD